MCAISPPALSRSTAATGFDPGVWRSAASSSQRCTLVRRDVIGLVALDLVLRIVWRRVVRVPLVVEIARMNLDDRAADVSGFRIPGDVIPDLEFRLHGCAPASRNKSSGA